LNAKKKIRLDQLLVERGLFPSRTRAQASIMAGQILVDGRAGAKAGERVVPDAEIEILGDECPYVSRGGLKLEGALKAFDIDPSGWSILDIGASTGGFTDCLLQSGGAHVTALDVGRGMIAWSLRTDERVTVLENINARNLEPNQVPGPYDMIVIDVSFISLKLIFPNLPSRLKPDGLLLALIKPQFEAGKGKAPGGVVRDPNVWRKVLQSYASDDIFDGMDLTGFSVSPVSGREGNREFFACWKKGRQNPKRRDVDGWIDAVIDEARRGD